MKGQHRAYTEKEISMCCGMCPHHGCIWDVLPAPAVPSTCPDAFAKGCIMADHQTLCLACNECSDADCVFFSAFTAAGNCYCESKAVVGFQCFVEVHKSHFV